MQLAKKKLYQIIIDDIQKQIDNRDFNIYEPICTEKSLCEKYSVSRITAKKAMEELCRKGILYRKRGVGSFVQDSFLTEQLAGKRPELSAKGKLIGGSSKIVAFILPFDISEGCIYDMINALRINLSQNDIYLSVSISGRSVENEKAIIRQLRAQPVSAIIFYPVSSEIHAEALIPFINRSIPVIVIDIAHNCRFMYNIVSDNIHGQQLLTQHLIDIGHKKIAYFAERPIDQLPSVRDRFYGYASTLSKNSIQLNYDFISTYTPKTSEKLKHLISQMLGLGVTAIEAEHDELAFQIYLSCRSLQLHIPKDIAITGFDDSKWATRFDVSLTTIKQNFIKISELISDIIISHIQGNPITICSSIIPVELIVRGSTIK